MNLRFLLILVIFSLHAFAKAQSDAAPKTATATRITKTPKIDGVLDDEIWKTLPVYGNFQMFEPENTGDVPAATKTEFQIAYTDKDFYVAVYMYDDNPDLIPTQFSQRDEIFVQADQLAVAINTYNDGQNETRFWTTSAGTIGDSRLTPGNQDFGFDTVFQCRVSTDDRGWYAEYRIPYNALRFPEVEVQDWSINIYRRLTRQNETHTWSPIDRTVGRETQYNGVITGIRNINPPVRLTLFPFLQATSNFNSGVTETEITGGLDIKYGLSDSFTLDAQLIPNFGQASFDAVRLNLGPFEQVFGENRAFFSEGVDLFNKGRIFFSRRIGSAPTGSVTLEENEELIEFPSQVNLLNSIKISGRTKENLGIGFLNSITEKTFAISRDTLTGERREQVVEPLTNYNVFVLDQQFNGNSSISLINTNVTRNGSGFRDGNVTAATFDVADSDNTYRVSGRGVVSSVNEEGGIKNGFISEFDYRKTTGNFRYRFGHDFSNTTADINDLGINNRNNFNSFAAGASYEIFQPTTLFNNYRISLTARHRRLYKPNVQTGNSLDLNTFFALKSRFAFGASADYNGKNNDYFEPRVQGRFVIFDSNMSVRGFVSSDYRKKFAYDIRANYRTWFDGDQDQSRYGINISPRYRFSDRLLVILSTDFNKANNNFGYISNSDDEIYFGTRNITRIENTVNLSYNFDPFKAINLRFRNFWSTADYSQNRFDSLNLDGTRSAVEDYESLGFNDPNTNFNIWNLDLSFRWRFAPGSEATLLYRNNIFNNDTQSQLGYTESLGNLFEQDIAHTVSLRITYFIDYNNVKGIFNKKA